MSLLIIYHGIVVYFLYSQCQLKVDNFKISFMVQLQHQFVIFVGIKMLRSLVKSDAGSLFLKILLKSHLSVIIEYPSYKILAGSKDLAPSLDVVDGELIDIAPRDLEHDFARCSTQHSTDAHKYRVNGITSKWLASFKRSATNSSELFKITDVPILHDGKLMGIYIYFNTITIDDILLFNDLVSHKVSSSKHIIDEYDELSDLEKETLFIAALNKSNKQIAEIVQRLGIRNSSDNTIKGLISQRIYKKLNVNNLNDAIQKAIKVGQINQIPQSILTATLKDYYLLETKDDCITI